MKKKPWKRLSQSDSEAVMRLVDEYQSSIKRIIVSVLKGQWPDAVDDILQDTYEEICRQLNLIEEAENRRAYVCKIAARLAIQAHRRLGRDLPLDEDVPAPEDLSFNLDTILPCSLSPSDKRLLKRIRKEGYRASTAVKTGPRPSQKDYYEGINLNSMSRFRK